MLKTPFEISMYTSLKRNVSKKQKVYSGAQSMQVFIRENLGI